MWQIWNITSRHHNSPRDQNLITKFGLEIWQLDADPQSEQPALRKSIYPNQNAVWPPSRPFQGFSFNHPVLINGEVTFIIILSHQGHNLRAHTFILQHISIDCDSKKRNPSLQTAESRMWKHKQASVLFDNQGLGLSLFSAVCIQSVLCTRRLANYYLSVKYVKSEAHYL